MWELMALRLTFHPTMEKISTVFGRDTGDAFQNIMDWK